ncbi:MAG TPA: DUF1501 domain-containing protein [Burkholderiaceae bacterium]|nr:DUF1501 domain-containing protein [Burkholderiaceae bacterium]
MSNGMERRAFLSSALGATVAALGFAPRVFAQNPLRLLVLIELRGGNDGLNTVAPVGDGRYHDLRPRLALGGDAVIALPDGPHLHAALAPWQALWNAGEMAVLESVGYPQPNLSHFRSIEIWDTASSSTEYLQQGWLTRAAASEPRFAQHSADGVVIGAADAGPLAGGARAVVLPGLAASDPQRLARQARLAHASSTAARGALAHVLRVENDITRAGAELRPASRVGTEFPRSPLGTALQHASALASTRRVPVIRVTLSGFDTHQNQAAPHARLLQQIGEGLPALRAALLELGLWQETLVLTYSEFGRRPQQNASGGTDHGTASVLFAFGPRVARGRFGAPADLRRLDAEGNLAHAVDFRAVYATVLERWWQIDSRRVLGQRYATVPFLRSA